MCLNVWLFSAILLFLNRQPKNFFTCNLIVVNAMTQVGKIKRWSGDDDERELSPEEPLPLYQQRENFYSWSDKTIFKLCTWNFYVVNVKFKLYWSVENILIVVV